MRIDQFLSKKGYFKSRQLAKEAIKDGRVKINGKIIKKCSLQVSESSNIEIIYDQKDKYVSRAALKLKYAIEKFKINFTDKTVLDVGSSTGGFTQVALEYGAKLVYAVDVGSKQLHPSLKSNPKVISIENCDARKLILQDKVDIIVMDVSFISAFKVLPSVLKYLKQSGKLILLFKPQFEVGIQNLKKGIAKSEAVPKVLQEAEEKLKELGLYNIQCTQSKILGKSGNIEYLFYATKNKPL